MKLSSAILTVVVSSSAWAQRVPNPFFTPPLGQVKEFLQLSDSQVQAILANNDQYNQWSREKQNRIAQVQTEIGEETAREQLDSNALGIRYMEIELICREMKSRANELRTRNLDVLSQDQKTKLKVLDDALKLAPVLSEAQYGNLIGDIRSAPTFFTSSSGGLGGSIIAGIIGGPTGCALPFPLSPPLTTNAPQRWFDSNVFVSASAPSSGSK